MCLYKDERNINLQYYGNHFGAELIGVNEGATNNFSIGIAIYDRNEYGDPGLHEVQEAFYIIEGFGTAKIGNDEIRIKPGDSFIAKAQTPHVIKKDIESVPIKLIWAHGAV